MTIHSAEPVVLDTPGYDMKFSVLGSGSKGNSVYIEAGNTAILIDAGFSGKEIKRRLQLIDRSVEKLKAVCITHEHNDHISGVGVVSRQCKIAAYANAGTFSAAEARMGKLWSYTEFETGDVMSIGDLEVRSFRISHDTADPVGFVVSDGKKSLGYCTDTGKVSYLMTQRLRPCKAIILEFNHNLELFKNGPYPLPLQQRVRSSLGHLSNEDAADFLCSVRNELMHTVILAHLSEINNRPQLAYEAVRLAIPDLQGTTLRIASQADPMLLMDI